MKLALGIVAILTTTAAAAPQTLRMQWRETSDVHIAEQAGAINHRQSIGITVKLLDGGKATASDDGSIVENNLYRDYYTTETTAWSNRWRGTWTLAKGTLVLELALDKRTCTKTKEHSDAKAEQLTCDAVDRAVKFQCTTTLVAVEDDAGKRTKVATWQCTTDAELADTPATWTLGKRICVRGSAFRGAADSFRPCGKD